MHTGLKYLVPGRCLFLRLLASHGPGPRVWSAGPVRESGPRVRSASPVRESGPVRLLDNSLIDLEGGRWPTP